MIIWKYDIFSFFLSFIKNLIIYLNFFFFFFTKCCFGLRRLKVPVRVRPDGFEYKLNDLVLRPSADGLSVHDSFLFLIQRPFKQDSGKWLFYFVRLRKGGVVQFKGEQWVFFRLVILEEISRFSARWVRSFRAVDFDSSLGKFVGSG